MPTSLVMRPATEDDAEWILSQVPRLHEFGPPPWRTVEQMNAGEIDIDAAVDAVLAAGGTLRERGEFAPGYPYAYVFDPDGYEIEIWFE